MSALPASHHRGCQFARSALLGGALLSGAFFAAVTGCDHGASETPAFRPGRMVYNTDPIDLNDFAPSLTTQRRVLHMQFGEAAARLGSLRFKAQSEMSFRRGNDSYEQRDDFLAEQDASGNFHVKLGTPRGQVEVYLVGESFFVRQDQGRLRNKPRREVEAEAWCDLAFASLRQSLELFRPGLTFNAAGAEDVGGRPAVHYRLSLGEPPQTEALPPPPVVLPVSPPAKWRELARPLDLKGSLWVDSQTGVVLKADISGRLEIADRDVRPTQLTVRYRGAMEAIGKVEPLEAPPSVPEYRREAPPRDLLSFFRDHLPPPEPEEPTEKKAQR